MSTKFIDGSQVDPLYEAQITRLVSQAATALEYCSEDELERYADALNDNQLSGDSK